MPLTIPSLDSSVERGGELHVTRSDNGRDAELAHRVIKQGVRGVSVEFAGAGQQSHQLLLIQAIA